MAGVVNKFENGHVPIVFIGDDDDRFDNGTIYWNPNAALNTTSGGTISPALALGHEMTHATGTTAGPTNWDKSARQSWPESPQKTICRIFGAL